MLIYIPLIGWISSSDISFIISILALIVSVVSFILSYNIKINEVRNNLLDKRTELLKNCAEIKILCEEYISTMEGLSTVTCNKFYDLPEFFSLKNELKDVLNSIQRNIEILQKFDEDSNSINAKKTIAIIQASLIDYEKKLSGFKNLHVKMKHVEEIRKHNPNFVLKYWTPKE